MSMETAKKLGYFNNNGREEELWKVQPQFPEDIEVSTFGRCRWLRHKMGRTHKVGCPFAGRGISAGYRTVSINGKTHKVHTLVLETFKPNTCVDIYTCVDHILNTRDSSGFKINTVKNLRWSNCLLNRVNPDNKPRNVRRLRNKISDSWQFRDHSEPRRHCKTFKTEAEALEYAKQIKESRFKEYSTLFDVMAGVINNRSEEAPASSSPSCQFAL